MANMLDSVVFLFKQKTAYEMRISDWSSDVCSSDLRRFLNDIDGFGVLLDAARGKLSGDANIGVAPHSLRAVTSDELAALLDMSPAGPVHIHAAEQVKEVADCVAWSGARPVEWLLDRSEKRRGGKEGFSTGISRWVPYH